jgi:hypothetical protein
LISRIPASLLKAYLASRKSLYASWIGALQILDGPYEHTVPIVFSSFVVRIQIATLWRKNYEDFSL